MPPGDTPPKPISSYNDQAFGKYFVVTNGKVELRKGATWNDASEKIRQSPENFIAYINSNKNGNDQQGKCLLSAPFVASLGLDAIKKLKGYIEYPNTANWPGTPRNGR